jgi:DNA-directed RNA polymerase specialized sigma24 family protein
MSAMSELAYDIEQLYIDGLSVREIAEELGCPVGIVTEWIDSQGIDA